MKRKGITIWEQNIEWIVLGVAVLFLLGFGGWQIVSSPNVADIPGQGEVAPGELDELLEQRAQALQARLAPDAPSPIEIPTPEPVLDEFLARLERPVSPSSSVMAMLPGVEIIEGTVVKEDAEYVVPEVPAPTKVAVDQYFDALSGGVVAQYEPLQDQFPEQPYDITWTSPAAVFDLAAMRAELAREGGDEVFPVPSNWYEGNISILDVIVEREELVKGEWTNHTTLEPIPGQLTYRSEIEEGVDKRRRDEIIYALQNGGQSGIVQPQFYDLVNSSWLPPDPERLIEQREEEGGAELSPEELEIRRLRRQLDDLVRQRQNIVDRLSDLGAEPGDCDEDDDDEMPEPPAGGGGGPSGGGGAPPGRGGGGGGFGAGSGGDMPGRRGGRDSAENKRKVEALCRRYANIMRQLDRVQNELGELNQAVDAEALAVNETPIMERDSVVIWGHDISVEHGKTYRYRFSVAVYNPFFARKLDLIEEQQDLADSLTIVSETSDWSEPIRILQPTKVFITRATSAEEDGGSLGYGVARAEVFRFYNGRWWRETFLVEPGDRIGRTTQVRRDEGDGPEIDFSTDWFVLDVVQDLAATQSEIDRGWGAEVVLRSLTDPAEMSRLTPRQDARSRERERLQSEVENANAAELIATTDDGEPTG